MRIGGALEWVEYEWVEHGSGSSMRVGGVALTWSEFLGFSLNHSLAISCQSVSSNFPSEMLSHRACFCGY